MNRKLVLKNSWISKLKLTDYVVVCDDTGRYPKQVGMIARISKTQLTILHEGWSINCSKKTGKLLRTLGPCHIEQTTLAEVLSLKEESKGRDLQRYNFNESEEKLVHKGKWK